MKWESKQTDNAVIVEQTEIARDIYRLTLETDLFEQAQPGQFFQVQVPGFYLRRPISISAIRDHEIVLIYKVVGQGTDRMKDLQAGQTLNLFGPLGTGFPITNQDVLLIGGGVGVPPLYETAKRYLAQGRRVDAALGFNTKEDAILVHELEEMGVQVHPASMDGSLGVKGTALDAIKTDDVKTDFVLACGPLPMLRAVSQAYSKGYVSLESRMACGMGACMGCVMKDHEGNSVRVCKDGPVFEIGKVVF